MAEQDIMPFVSPHGGSTGTRAFPVAASETYRHGEPLILSSNELQEAATDPAAIVGIAAQDARDIANDPTGGLNGQPASAGTPRTVYLPVHEQTFLCRNYSADGTGATLSTPAVAQIGTLAGLVLNSGVWSVDTAANNLICQINDVLDARKNSIDNPNLVSGTATYVVVEFI